MSLFSIDELSQPNLIQDVQSAAMTRKEKKQATMLARAQAALQEVISDRVRKGVTIHYATMGDWSTHNLVEYIVDQIGPAHLYAATWSMTEDPVRRLLNMGNQGKLLSINMLLDWRVKVRCQDALQLAKANFSALRVADCHAKVSVLVNDHWAISIVGSANYTNNPRIEAGVITEGRDAADFHLSWINATMNNASPFEEERTKCRKR